MGGGFSGLNANYFRFEPKRVARCDTAANPRSLADADVEHIEIGVFAQQLQSVGRYARDEIAMECGNGDKAA